jgi:hypothetical protein
MRSAIETIREVALGQREPPYLSRGAKT